MILFKMQVAADTTYSFPNQSNCVLFDTHNDSPFNMGVSFGRDTGADNADYFTSPHSVLTGIGPKGNAPSVGNARWNGTIYIYTETPLGTGTTDLTTAPAFQITMIGYPAGYQPSGTTSLSRMTSTPNTVATNAMTSTANAISTLGDSPGTPIITAKPSDVAVQNTWSADNSGNLLIQGDNAGVLTTLLQLVAGASPAVLIGAATIIAEVLGGMKIDGTLFTDTIKANDASGVTIDDSTGTAQGVFTNSGITLNANVQMNNNLTVSGNYIWKNGNTISRVSTFTGSGTGTYNHNAGSAPTWVGAIVSISGSATQGFDSAGATTVHVTLGAALAFKAFTIKDT